MTDTKERTTFEQIDQQFIDLLRAINQSEPDETAIKRAAFGIARTIVVDLHRIANAFEEWNYQKI